MGTHKKPLRLVERKDGRYVLFRDKTPILSADALSIHNPGQLHAILHYVDWGKHYAHLADLVKANFQIPA